MRFVRPFSRKGSDTPKSFHEIEYVGKWGMFGILSVDSALQGNV